MSESSGQVPIWVGKVVEIEEDLSAVGPNAEDDHVDGDQWVENGASGPSVDESGFLAIGSDTSVVGGAVRPNGSGPMTLTRSETSNPPETLSRPDTSRTQPDLLAPLERPSSRRSGPWMWILAVLSGVVVVALALFAFLGGFGSNGDPGDGLAGQDALDTSGEVGDDNPSSQEASSRDGGASSENSNSAGGDSTGRDSAGGDSADNDPADTGPVKTAPSAELYRQEAAARSRDAYGVFAAGRLQLLGTWPSREEADALAGRASVIVGEQNVTVDAEFLAEEAGRSGEGVSPVLFVDQPLTLPDSAEDLDESARAEDLDESARFLLESAGALMVVYPDTRLTLIVPGLQSVGSGSNEPELNGELDTVLNILDQIGIPADRISVEASAATTDETVAPFAMLSGGLFVP